MSNQSNYPPIILTHPTDSSDYLLKQISQMGLEVLVDPMVTTSPITLTPKQIKEICNSDIIIFTSKRGVQYAMEQINPICCQDKQIAVIGKKTAESLMQCHGKPVWVSTGQSSKEMCTELIEQGIVQGKKVVALLAQMADDSIEQMLTAECQYVRINIYQTKPQKHQNPQIQKILSEKSDVWIVFTSSSAVHAFAKIYHEFKNNNIKCFSIGPTTSSAIIEMGQTVAHEANPSTYETMMTLISDNIKTKALTQQP